MGHSLEQWLAISTTSIRVCTRIKEDLGGALRMSLRCAVQRSATIVVLAVHVCSMFKKHSYYFILVTFCRNVQRDSIPLPWLTLAQSFINRNAMCGCSNRTAVQNAVLPPWQGISVSN